MAQALTRVTLLLLVSLLFTRLNNSQSDIGNDTALLLKFKASIKDPLFSLDNWRLNKSVCQWFGVSCSSSGRVTALSLQSLQLSGEFPTTLVQGLPHLHNLTISNNNFTGSISDMFKNCTLVVLDVSRNKFTGSFINDSSARCETLRFLNISYNALSGRLNLDGAKLDSLEVLDGSRNEFSGEVPMLPSLKILNLSSNKFNKITGNGSICSKTSPLERFIVANNVLSGSIFDSVMSCSSLQVLDLSVNSLTGTIPMNLCKSLPRLQHMHVWSNKIEGYIPLSIGECSSLYTLILSYNNLQGTIPHELSKLHNIVHITLNSNNLTGEIPPSLGQLQNLITLQASNNSLSGEIPRQFANCSSLTWLNLNMNQLTGSIPPSIGRTKQGSNRRDSFTWVKRVSPVNPYHGCQGKGIDELFLLIGIDMEAFNSLPMVCQRRTLIVTLQNNLYPDADSPMVVDFSYNRLSGSIPIELGNMRTLFQLNLAHNQLDGPIPSNLASARNLTTLDLSENSLSGEIPNSFSQLSFLAHLNVSYNNLSGLIPQHGQLTTFQVSSYQGNPGLCGFPLGECPVGVLNPRGRVDEEDDDKLDIILVAVVVGAVCFVAWSTMILYLGSSLGRCLYRMARI